MQFAIAVVIVMATMALKDMLGTAMVMFESKGNGNKAGIMDAFGDVANFIYMAVGVDAFNKVGFSIQAAIMLVAICFTSYNVTKYTTNYFKEKK